MEDHYIRKTIAGLHGSRERTEVLLEVDIKTGKSELIISKTIIEYYPVTDYEKVMDLHKKLNRSGRKRYSLEDLTRYASLIEPKNH